MFKRITLFAIAMAFLALPLAVYAQDAGGEIPTPAQSDDQFVVADEGGGPDAVQTPDLGIEPTIMADGSGFAPDSTMLPDGQTIVVADEGGGADAVQTPDQTAV